MTTTGARTQTRTQKVGWGILLFISALMVLNGVVWFFAGPSRSGPYMARVAGMPEQEFRQLYPGVVEGLSRNRRQVGIWYAAFGAMALVTAVGGLRLGTRWAWHATWAVPAAPIAIGIVYSVGVGELAFDNLGLFTFGALALVGQLLARPT